MTPKRALYLAGVKADRYRRMRDERDAAVIAALNAGATLDQTAEATGLSRGGVANIRDRMKGRQ